MGQNLKFKLATEETLFCDTVALSSGYYQCSAPSPGFHTEPKLDFERKTLWPEKRDSNVGALNGHRHNLKCFFSLIPFNLIEKKNSRESGNGPGLDFLTQSRLGHNAEQVTRPADKLRHGSKNAQSQSTFQWNPFLPCTPHPSVSPLAKSLSLVKDVSTHKVQRATMYNHLSKPNSRAFSLIPRQPRYSLRMTCYSRAL